MSGEIKRTWLLSIHPGFARALYAGDKRYEYRRRRVNLATGDRVLVYESAPVSAVTGEFKVGEVRVAAAAVIDVIAGVPLDHLEAAYLEGASTASAIEAMNPIRWQHAESVQAYGLARPPVSYARVYDAG
ncbi:MAG: ASCH domain-containing protein [Acidimicrobiia bacterium]|nr:ASCH domain-containing protein [Acidimicrobiia bacterium]